MPLSFLAILRKNVEVRGFLEMIHYYQLLGKNIVLDVFSGAVHVLDDTAYDVVAYFGQDFINSDTCPEGLLSALAGKYTKDRFAAHTTKSAALQTQICCIRRTFTRSMRKI